MNAATWMPAYIGIGSNLDNPTQQVAMGFDALTRLPSTRLIARSRLYRTRPLGPQDQPEYVNAVAGILTQLDADTLLAQLKQLETQLGRAQPIVRWGPRVIDFDLLAFGNAKQQSEVLTLPHPGVANRDFVLIPFADIAPEFNVPGLGRISQLAARIDRTGLALIR